MPADPVIIIMEGCDLPSDGDTVTKQFLAELLASVSEEFAQYDALPDTYRVYDGNIRTQTNFERRCPECDAVLDLTNLSADDMNGVDAQAACSCGWRGRAVYRLTDLEEHPSKENMDPQQMVSWVGDNGMDVLITGYKGTTEYRRSPTDRNQQD